MFVAAVVVDILVVVFAADVLLLLLLLLQLMLLLLLLLLMEFDLKMINFENPRPFNGSVVHKNSVQLCRFLLNFVNKS